MLNMLIGVLIILLATAIVNSLSTVEKKLDAVLIQINENKHQYKKQMESCKDCNNCKGCGKYE